MVSAFRYFWLLALVATVLNASIWCWNGKQWRQRDPALTESYRKLTRGFVIWGSLPWLVMGLGCMLGGLNAFDYFDPARGNPWVIAFFASVFVIWVLLAHWVFVRDGAEQVARHPGLLRHGFSGSTETPAWAVKALVALALAGGVAGVVMMFLGFPPPPRPR